MRITDDRYTRDRLRLDLALRLIRHEARTRTIRSWTGLTDDRIRKLYRSYVADAGRRDVRRHRGKSPRQSAFFMRNAGIRREAAGLATLLCVLGLLRRESTATAGAVEQLRWGESFCEAYETFISLNRASADLFRACLPPDAIARKAERNLPRRLRGLRQPARRHALCRAAQSLRVLRDEPAARAPRALGGRLLEWITRFSGTGTDAPQRIRRAACRSTQVRKRRRRIRRARDRGGFGSTDSCLEIALPCRPAPLARRLPAAVRKRSVRRHRHPRNDPARRLSRSCDLHDRDRVRGSASASGRRGVRRPSPRGRAAAARRGGPGRLCARDDLVPAPTPLSVEAVVPRPSRRTTAA